MSIKQNGGVFGRNPTFNDVTIEGTLTFDGDIDINSDLKVNGEIEAQKLIIAKNDRPNGAVIDITNTFEGSGWVGGDLIGSVDFKITDGSTPQKIRAALRAEVDSSVSSSTYPYRVGVGVYTSNLAVLTKTAEFDYLGNLKMNSGNGIDFSATAGTGTSELLSDYEQGVWTPELRFGGATPSGIVQASSLGYYTKVGNLVTVQLKIILSSKGAQTGNAEIYGLPFAAGAGGDAGAYPSFFNNLNLTASQVPIGKASGSDIELRYPIAGVAQRMNHSHITDTTDIRMFSSYYI